MSTVMEAGKEYPRLHEPREIRCKCNRVLALLRPNGQIIAKYRGMTYGVKDFIICKCGYTTWTHDI